MRTPDLVFNFDCSLNLADWKSKLTLYDQTTEDWSQGIDLNIFLPEHEMPKVEVGDIVIAWMVKRQRWQGSPSLLSNKSLSDIHVYDGQGIAKCRDSRSAKDALKPSSRRVRRELDQKEHEYVLWLYNKVDQTYVPDREQAKSRAEQTLHIRDKFSLLQDVKIRKFADLIAQVVRDPFDQGDKITLWVSDYTENSHFFNKTDDSSSWVDGEPIRDGDPYGYVDKWNKPAGSIAAGESWLGPSGKRSIQLTCWEPHANFIRSGVRTSHWVHLRNVQIDIGKNGQNVEGFLRTDRTYPERVCVSVLDHTADREMLDARLVDALRRKRDYERDLKQTQRGTKRKAEMSRKGLNSKDRRKANREEKAKASREEKAKANRQEQAKSNREEQAEAPQEQGAKQKIEVRLGLNSNIRCENADRTSVAFSSILEPVRYDTTFDLPFTCAKYLTQARVVDFHPARLQDFAAKTIITEFSALSDNSDADSDSSASSEEDGRGGSSDRVQWEWRFALKLEDTSVTSTTGKKPATAWVLVDNLEGQLLTSLDAVDLRDRRNADLLEKLRQKLFHLWGELEETKSAIEARKRKAGLEPPDLNDDDDNQDNSGEDRHDSALSQVKNKPFACCIRQYGVKVSAEEGEEGGAGGREKWQRVFGLFGTQIAGDVEAPEES